VQHAAHSMPEDDPATPAGPRTAEGRMTPLKEMQLVDAHRDGDPAALTELLSAYQRRIYGVCIRMVRDPDLAADLTQESLVKVIDGLDGFDGRAALSTWVIRVTMNCCLGHLRKAQIRRHASLDEPLAGSSTPLSAAIAGGREPPASESVEQSEMGEVLMRALETLEPPMRAVLVLRDLQDLDYQQIGTVLGVPVGTVKSRLFRARAALREAVETRTGGAGTGNETESGES